MYGFPGSHKTPTTYFSKLNATRDATYYEGPEPKYENHYKIEDAACLEVPKGSVICLHGDLVHYSSHNHSNIPRNAFTLHLVEGHNNNWSKDSWL